MEQSNFIPPLRTAESVTLGHPDKLCDQFSDAILDEALKQDPNSRVAIEALGGHGAVYICGEMTTKAFVDVPTIVRQVYRQAGYTDQIGILTNIVSQSPDIAQGVDTGGAGDQGIMVGYATDETPEMLPAEVIYSRKLAMRLQEVREKDIIKGLKPDGKTQVTLDPEGKVVALVISTQHDVDRDLESLKSDLKSAVIDAAGIPITPETKFFVNPTGRFVQGGFEADTGLTGRKLAVDNYGPSIAIGGGCFSGKDPSKVDRSAAYMARRIAVDLLKKRGAHRVFVQLAYSIGVAEPVMATALVDGQPTPITGYDLTPKGIIAALKLRQPQYLPTARYGHFGHGFTWE